MYTSLPVEIHSTHNNIYSKRSRFIACNFSFLPIAYIVSLRVFQLFRRLRILQEKCRKKCFEHIHTDRACSQELQSTVSSTELLRYNNNSAFNGLMATVFQDVAVNTINSYEEQERARAEECTVEMSKNK